LNIFEKWKTNLTTTGPIPRLAQLHSGAWPTPTASAQPVCTARAAHGLPGRPRPVTAWRGASAHRSGHRSPGARRGMAGGGATVAEAKKKTALEHPRRRGYPSGMGVEGARAPLTVEDLATAEAAGQRWWRAQTATVGSEHGRRHGWDGRA
jgi:hypothetical protein